MNKGDTIRLILDYSINEDPITEGQFDDLELQLNKDAFGKFHLKKLLSQNDITWDAELGKYVCHLSQEETFNLPNVVEYQLRCYDDGSVVSSRIDRFFIGDTLSKEVLPYAPE